MKNNKLDNAIAIIIKCTRRVKRPIDLITLSRNILYAKKELKGIKNVAKEVGLSVQQLQDFLAVERLSSKVKTLTEDRKIDSVDVVKTISKLPIKQQEILADFFISGKITSKDVRHITTFAKKFPDKSMKKIISDYEKSKDIKIYVAHFQLPNDFKGESQLRSRFEQIIGTDEINKLNIQKKKVTLEVTALGYKKLRETVRKKRMTLRKFMESIVNEFRERK